MGELVVAGVLLGLTACLPVTGEPCADGVVCPIVCGDGICEGGEVTATCPGDCPA
ncbi:MAG: hypothetical protein R2939_01725 [Kofleriaceae bacterium]